MAKVEEGWGDPQQLHPPHTYQYLNWESNHHLEHKVSLVHMLLRKVQTAVSELCYRKEEVNLVKKTLTAHEYKQCSLEISKEREREKVEEPSK